MNTEDSEFERIEAEALRRAVQDDDDDTQVYKKPWVGLTDEDWEKVANRKGTSLDTFEQGATWAAYKLERLNK